VSIAPDRTSGERALRHICEICGKDEVLLPSEAFDSGWDYPPRMGHFGIISPRTCGDCPMDGTLWWALTSGARAQDLTEAQRATVERINGEPETILP